MPTVARLTLQVDSDGIAETAAELQALDRILAARAANWSQLSRRFVVDADAEASALNRVAGVGTRANDELGRSFERPRDALGRFVREGEEGHDRVGRAADRNTASHRRMGGIMGVVGQQITRMAARGAILTNALVPLAAAGFQVGAALTPIIGLAGAIPGLLVAGGVAAATGALAFHGMGDALTAMGKAQDGSKASMEALNKALAALPPAARPVVRQLFEMRGMVTALRETAAAGIMPGVSAVLTSLRGLFPIVRREIGQTATQVGLLGRGFAAMASSPMFRRDFQTLVGSSSRLTRQFGDAVLLLVQAFMDVGVVGQPLVAQFGNLVRQSALAAANFTRTTRASGQMASFFRSAGDVAERLFGIIADVVTIVVNLGRIAAPSGAGLLDMLANLLDRAARASRNLDRLRAMVQRVADVFVVLRLAILGAALGPWGAAAGALAGGLVVLYRRSETFRGVIQAIGGVIQRNVVPAFQSLVGWVMGQLVPAIRAVIPFVRDQLSAGFNNLSRAIGRNRGEFAQVGRIILQVAGWILTNLIPVIIKLYAVQLRAMMDGLAAAIRVFGFVVRAIGTVVNIVATVGRAIGAFVELMRRAWNTVRTITANVWGFFRQVVFDNIARVRNEIVKSIVGLIPRNIREGWNNASRSTSDAWNRMRNAVTDGTRRALSTITGWGRSVRGFFGNLISDMLGFGRRMWNNVLSGIRGVDLLGGIRGLLNRAINLLNSFGRGVARVGNIILPGDPIQWPGIPQLRQRGGEIHGLARGDNVPVMAEGGEVMIRNQVAQPLRGLLLAINNLPASSARALARTIAGTRSPDIGGDPGTMVIGRGTLTRPDRQGIQLGMANGGVVQHLAAGGNVAMQNLIGRTQSWIRAQDPKPYVWGGTGPGGWDCSGLAGGVYAMLTGQNPYRRYFTTGSIPAGTSLRAGRGTYTIGVTPGVGHMVGNLAGLPFEARSTATGIFTGSAARSVTSMARQFYLPQAGGTFIGGGGGIDFLGMLTRLLNRVLGPVRRGLGALGGGSDNMAGAIAGGMGSNIVDAVGNWVKGGAGMAWGGDITEPILGMGRRTGQLYNFGERGAIERYTPASARAGGGDVYNFNVSLAGTYAEPITMGDVHRAIGSAVGMLRANRARTAGVGRT